MLLFYVRRIALFCAHRNAQFPRISVHQSELMRQYLFGIALVFERLNATYRVIVG